MSNAVADRLRHLRSEVLEHPNCLLGMREPPIDAVWGWTQAMTHAINVAEARAAGSWGRFLHEHRFGSRTEYSKLQESHGPFAEKIAFLRDLYAAYDEWLMIAPERSEALFMYVEDGPDGANVDLLEQKALERLLKGTTKDTDVVSGVMAWANNADLGAVKTFDNVILTRVLAGTSLVDER